MRVKQQLINKIENRITSCMNEFKNKLKNWQRRTKCNLYSWNHEFKISFLSNNHQTRFHRILIEVENLPSNAVQGPFIIQTILRSVKTVNREFPLSALIFNNFTSAKWKIQLIRVIVTFDFLQNIRYWSDGDDFDEEKGDEENEFDDDDY